MLPSANSSRSLSLVPASHSPSPPAIPLTIYDCAHLHPLASYAECRDIMLKIKKSLQETKRWGWGREYLLGKMEEMFGGVRYEEGGARDV